MFVCDEAKSAAFARAVVAHDGRLFDLSILRKEFVQRLVDCEVGQSKNDELALGRVGPAAATRLLAAAAVFC